jgi:uncharacterized metal-binding protein
MPEGPAHLSGAFLVALCGGFAAGALSRIEYGVVFAGAALVGELWLSPDLDHDSGARPYRRWGPLRILWLPYQRAIPHRSPVSHWPILGTAGRLVYVAVLALPVVLVLDVDLTPIVRHDRILLWSVAGLEASAVMHWACDTFL